MTKDRSRSYRSLNDFGSGFEMTVSNIRDTADVDIVWIYDGEPTNHGAGFVADAYDLLEMIELLSKARDEVLAVVDEQEEFDFEPEFDIDEEDFV